MALPSFARSTALAVTAGTLLVAAMLPVLAPVVRAQEAQPIYPAYDGFLKNPDGSYTVAFAYFSHNAQTVTVAPGADNSFSPDPGDRMQPTTFKPGHWRFQCVMVLGPEFDGKLTWTLSYGGTKTGTSQNMLQSNWNLVEGAQDLAKVDFKNAKRGVCLNRAPIVRVLGSIRRERENALAVVASVGENFSLFGSVNDEGLPRNKALVSTWKQISGPGNARFENASAPRTHVVFPAAGSYVLELSSSDSEFSASTRVTVDVK